MLNAIDPQSFYKLCGSVSLLIPLKNSNVTKGAPDTLVSKYSKIGKRRRMTDNSERIFKQIKTIYRKNLPEADPDWPPKITNVVNCIRSHLFNDELSVGWIKEQCRINGNNFSGKFSFYVGMSPQQYYYYHRIETAKKLLSAPELKDVRILHIAMNLGFKSPTSFSTTFKNHMGCTPSEFRDRSN